MFLENWVQRATDSSTHHRYERRATAAPKRDSGLIWRFPNHRMGKCGRRCHPRSVTQRRVVGCPRVDHVLAAGAPSRQASDMNVFMFAWRSTRWTVYPFGVRPVVRCAAPRRHRAVGKRGSVLSRCRSAVSDPLPAGRSPDSNRGCARSALPLMIVLGFISMVLHGMIKGAPIEPCTTSP